MLHRTSTSVELKTATYEIPSNTPHPEFAIPTEVIDFVITEFSLNNPRHRVIDPFPGNARFLQRIRERGGRADGIELDPQQFAIGTEQLALIKPGQFTAIDGWTSGELKLGDCTKTTPNFMGSYSAIYTSPPFTLMHELAKERHPYIAVALYRMLHPEGVLIIDSADKALRNGRELTPALDTINYLTNAGKASVDGLFSFVASHKFTVTEPPNGCDGQFTELVFVKRWPTYQDVLAAIATHKTVLPPTA